MARLFREQSPWVHDGGTVPARLAPAHERPLAQVLWRAMHHGRLRRHYLVVGPRRVGKTTCLYQTVRHLVAAGVEPRKIRWLRLDHPLLTSIDLGTLVRWLVEWSQASSEAPVYVFLDEITYAEKWDLWLKTFHDDHWPVRIAASSSATALMRRARHESGVGRWDELYLPPYSYTEYLSLIGAAHDMPAHATLAETLGALTQRTATVPNLHAELRRFLLTGGFPELLLAGADTSASEAEMFLGSQEQLRNDAVSRAIYQDIPQAFGIERPRQLERLLYVLGGQLANLMSPTSIASTLDMSVPTFEKYLAYLEQAYLVFTTPSYAPSEVQVQKRGRKLYFVDGAIRNAALQRGTSPLENPAEHGLLLENAVASHLHTLSQLRQSRLYYWQKDRSGAAEVDLVLDEHASVSAFEVARGADHPRRGLRAFAERFPAARGRCHLVSPDAGFVPARESEDGVGALPLQVLLQALGAQAEAALRLRLAP